METGDVSIGTGADGDTPDEGDFYAKGDARVPKVIGKKKKKKMHTFKRWLKESSTPNKSTEITIRIYKLRRHSVATDYEATSFSGPDPYNIKDKEVDDGNCYALQMALKDCLEWYSDGKLSDWDDMELFMVADDSSSTTHTRTLFADAYITMRVPNEYIPTIKEQVPILTEKEANEWVDWGWKHRRDKRRTKHIDLEYITKMTSDEFEKHSMCYSLFEGFMKFVKDDGYSVKAHEDAEDFWARQIRATQAGMKRTYDGD